MTEPTDHIARLHAAANAPVTHGTDSCTAPPMAIAAQADLIAVLAEHKQMAARVAELEAERDADLAVMTAFLLPTKRSDAWWHAILANHFGPRCQELTEDVNRFATARSRVNDLPKAVVSPGADCDHDAGWQCVKCVPEDGFAFQPLGNVAGGA